jgi:hypothetical protein
MSDQSTVTDKPAPAESQENSLSAPQPARPAPAFKRYYTPHELERERIRRELAEPYRLKDLKPNHAKSK